MNEKYKFAILEKRDGKITNIHLQELSSINLNINNLWNNLGVKQLIDWQELIVFALLFRTMGKWQRVIINERLLDEDPNNKNIEFVHDILWRETSTISHFHKYDKNRLETYLKDLSKILGLDQKKISNMGENINNTYEIIEMLDKYTQSKNNLIIKNVISSMEIRCKLEKLSFENTEENGKKVFENIFDTKYGKESKAISLKNEKIDEDIRLFVNQNKWLIFNLTHFTENDLYKYVEINKTMIDEIKKDFEDLEKRIKSK